MDHLELARRLCNQRPRLVGLQPVPYEPKPTHGPGAVVHQLDRRDEEAKEELLPFSRGRPSGELPNHFNLALEHAVAARIEFGAA